MRVYTVGFTAKSAERFFALLKNAGVQRVIDVRLRNTSQLSAFAKASDLNYFLRVILGIHYIHIPDLAPSDERMGARLGWRGDRSGGEGDAATVHGGVQAEDRPGGRRL